MTKTSAILLWTVAGALLACAATPSAMAGCHLPFGPASPGEGGLELLADLGALADKPTPPPRSPCGGFRCSGDPAPASTIHIVDRAECWDHLARFVLDKPGATPYPIAPPTPLRPSHGGPPPFRPPWA